MSWNPKYTITNQLVLTIREIGEAIGEIKSMRLTVKALAQLELDARALSTYASTSIEGNPLPLTDVKQLLKGSKQHIRDTEREVLNYNAALKDIYQSVRSNRFSLNLKTLEKLQKQVVDGLMDNPTHCGKLRQDAVIIRNPRNIDEVVFIPPDAKDVKGLMLQLITFIKENTGKIDPVILAGLFHRQYVIIHPFMDGNGRTTRLLTTALLGDSGLNFFEIFSFENYYNQKITGYFKAVGLEGDYYDLKGETDFTGWLEYFSEGILDELSRIRKALPARQRQSPRIEPHHEQILDYIRKHGSITQREYGQVSKRSLASRKLDFDKLVQLNFIKSEGNGRATHYIMAKGHQD